MLVTADSIYSANFFLLPNGSSLLLEGIELNGLIPDTTEFNAANHFIVLEAAASITYVKIVDCHLHSSEGRVLDDNDGASVDTVIIDNCLVHDCDGGPYFKDADLNGLIKVTNSTIANLTDRFIRAQSGDAAGYIDHCTVYNLSGKRIIMAKGNSKQWIVTNSIFSTFTGSSADDCIRPGDNAADSLAFCILHSDVGLHKDWEVVADTSTADPLFTDPENGDLTLQLGSPALTMAADGGAIGDPRWVSGTTGIKKNVTVAPVDFKLSQNYPNPFNPTTRISFTLTTADYTTLTVHNMLGQVIATLVDKNTQSGNHELTFNAAGLPSGVYFYQIKSGQHTSVRKMILMQ